MEELIVITKKESNKILSYLCSNTLCLEDTILFENDSEILEAIVKKIDIVNQTVTILSNNQSIEIEQDKCFFPIIELYNKNNHFTHKQIVQRDELKFSTICPECEKNSRSLNDCSVSETICKKNKLKPYAFKK